MASSRDPFTWKSGSSQLLRRRQLVLGSVLFHVGILVIFFGHLVGLLTPIALFEALAILMGGGVKNFDKYAVAPGEKLLQDFFLPEGFKGTV